MALKKSILLLFIPLIGFSQISLDSISFTYFENENIQKIQSYKSELGEHTTPYKLYEIGKLYEYTNKEDSAAKYYAIALDLYKQEKNTIGQLKVFPDIISLIKAQNFYQFDANGFRKEYWNLIQDQPKYGLHYTIYKKLEANDSILNNNFDAALNILYALKNHSNPKDSLNLYATVLNNLGVCHKNKKTHLDSAKYYYQKSLSIGKTSNSPNTLFYNYLNQGNFYFEKGNYPMALQYYDSSASNPPENYKMKNYRLLYLCLSDTYNAIGDYKKSVAYLKAHNKLDSLIDEKEQNKGIFEIETQYNLKETQKQLNILQKFTESYKRHRIYYISGLILTFLLSLYSFIRWKKVDQKKRKIEQERNRIQLKQQQTVREKELTEREKEHLSKERDLIERQKQEKEKEVTVLKSLVVKEHIVLSNNAKINLTDLMYIKSDKHYLLLFTKDNKEFVRGKVYEILEQLPPNFIQTHRSFIVNINYAHYRTSKAIFLSDNTEIPVSRTYSEKVKEMISKQKKS